MTSIIGWTAAAVFFVLPAVVCALKRRWGAAAFGAVIVAAGWYAIAIRGDLGPTGGHWAVAFLGMFASILLIAVAMDYAHPQSPWARWFYDEDKMRRAAHRATDFDGHPGRGEVRAMRNYGQTRFGRKSDS